MEPVGCGSRLVYKMQLNPCGYLAFPLPPHAAGVLFCRETTPKDRPICRKHRPESTTRAIEIGYRTWVS